MQNDPVNQERPVSWTFLSNHAHVLFCLARNRDARLREVADLVGITERAAFKIVTELEEAGVIVGYVAQLDARRLGNDVTAFIGVDACSL